MGPIGAVLEARGLTKDYDTGGEVVSVLSGVDLRVDAGSFVAVTGPSGSGKTTLLNLLGLLEAPTSGSLTIAGVQVDDLDERGRTLARRQRLGFVFQQHNLVPALTAVENVALPLVIDGAPRRQRRPRAIEALAAVGLDDARVDRRPHRLSGGERQRVAIARALIGDPAIVFADEPTGSLDAGTGAGVLDVLDRLRRDRDTTVVMVTHDPAVAADADRRVAMERGRLQSTDG